MDATMLRFNEGQWLELPAALLLEAGTLRLRESPCADVTALMRHLWNGTYTKPFVLDDGAIRRMHFSLDYVQTEMSIDDPYALTFSYTRKMMAFLLFVPRPKHLVIVGLGGGSLTKFCYQQLPRTSITTIEIDGDVIEFSKLFHVPRQDARMRILHADATEYFAHTEELADVILIDGCDKHGVSPTLCSEDFYRKLRDRLQPEGVLVMNLIGPCGVVQDHLQHIRAAFSGRIIILSVDLSTNQLVFAFNNQSFSPDWPIIHRLAEQLLRRHGLDFPHFSSKLRYSCSFASRSLRGFWMDQSRYNSLQDD